MFTLRKEFIISFLLILGFVILLTLMGGFTIIVVNYCLGFIIVQLSFENKKKSTKTIGFIFIIVSIILAIINLVTS